MTARPPHPASRAEPASPSTEDAGSSRRLRAHLWCLAVSFGVYAVVHNLASGIGPFAISGLVLAALLALPVVPARFLEAGPAVQTAVLAAALVALALPLAGAVSDGTPIPAAIANSTVWPQFLVLLFGARSLTALTTLRFARFWRHPLAARPAPTQSMAAALLLGLAMALLFYRFAGAVAVDPARLDPWAVTLRALAGQSVLHVAIVVLFFWLLAALLDAALVLREDAAALAALRYACRAGPGQAVAAGPPDVAALLSGPLAYASHTRAALFVAQAGTGHPAAGPHSLETFHAASRRLVGALLSLLPLMGFLGTVIGLTAAIGGLPSGMGAGARFDVGASLLGLALKFETTLLGILGAVIASLLLSFLERHEKELEAECLRLAEALSDAG